MADEKATSLDVIKPRRRVELRDLAIAAFYPQTRSTTPLSAITPAVQSLQKRNLGERDSVSHRTDVLRPLKVK
jgi:hypothetical protein